MVNRLHRFPDYRFIGRRDMMVVYDCDDQSQLAELDAAVRELELDRKNLLQAFAPDDLSEAANRGFAAVRSSSAGA